MKKTYTVTGLTFCALLIVLFATDPNHVSSVGLIVPFVLLFIFLASLFLIYFKRTDFSKSQQFRLSALSAGLPCMFLVLRSVDQLTVRDVVILLGFFCLSCFYVMRSASTGRS
ncbi:MAG TPA: hypothetical protein VIM53_03765 [Candidatus Saccharimonadales bacterium]